MSTFLEVNELDEQDAKILSDRLEMYNALEGPRVGDWVIWSENEGARQYRRFSHDWGETIQTSFGGRWYLGEGYMSFSGGLEPPAPKTDFVDTLETKSAICWFFHHDKWRAGNGVEVFVEFRVFRYTGGRP